MCSDPDLLLQRTPGSSERSRWPARSDIRCGGPGASRCRAPSVEGRGCRIRGLCRRSAALRLWSSPQVSGWDGRLGRRLRCRRLPSAVVLLSLTSSLSHAEAECKAGSSSEESCDSVHRYSPIRWCYCRPERLTPTPIVDIEQAYPGMVRSAGHRLAQTVPKRRESPPKQGSSGVGLRGFEPPTFGPPDRQHKPEGTDETPNRPCITGNSSPISSRQ